MTSKTGDSNDSVARPRRIVRPVFGVILGVVALVGGSVAFKTRVAEAKSGSKQTSAENSENDEKQALPVGVEPVVRDGLEHYLIASTTVESERSVEVVARIDGFVSEVLVDEGDTVEKGQPLARLDDRKLGVELRKAELNVANADRARKRAEELERRDLITQTEHDKATLAYDVALADREAARIALSHTTVRAPFSGRITMRNLEVGQQLKPGLHVFTAQDFDPLIAHIHIPAHDADRMAVEQEVRFVMETKTREHEPKRFLGRVSRVSPVVDEQTGTIKVRLALLEPPDSIRPGSFLRVEILDDVRTEALVVSKKAIVHDATQPYVYRTDGKSVERVPIGVGLDTDSRVEIVSGLSEGDQVVVVGKEGLKDGTVIKIVS